MFSSELRKQEVVCLQHCFPLALGSALLASSHMLQVLPQAEALLYKHVHSCTCRRISENPGSGEHNISITEILHAIHTELFLSVWF